MLPPFFTLYGIHRGRSWPLRVQAARTIDPPQGLGIKRWGIAQTYVERILLVVVRMLASLFLFIVTIGVMLIYGIIVSGLSLASWARSLGMKQTANQDMQQRAADRSE